MDIRKMNHIKLPRQRRDNFNEKINRIERRTEEIFDFNMNEFSFLKNKKNNDQITQKNDDLIVRND